MWAMVVLRPCLRRMFFFQLPIILFTRSRQQILDTTLLEKWHAIFTGCCRNLRSLVVATDRRIGGMRNPKAVATSCVWWKGLSLWESRDVWAGQSWKPVFADWVLPWCPSFCRGLFELFAVDPCFEVAQRTRYELLLPCNCGWWGWHCSFPAVRQALGWRERSWSMQVWILVFFAGGTTAEAVVHEELPWRRQHPVVFLHRQVSALVNTCITFFIVSNYACYIAL